MKRLVLPIVVVASLVGVRNAGAAAVTFEGDRPGRPIEYVGNGVGLLLVTAAGGEGDEIAATVLNTEGSLDPNIRYEFNGGNLAKARLRNALVVPAEPGGSVTDPGGGRLTLTFIAPVRSLGFDVIDVDLADAAQTTATFRAQGNDVLTIPFSDFTSRTSPHRRPGVVWGDATANRITPFELDGQFVDFFDEVEFRFPSEMAFDNFNYRIMPLSGQISSADSAAAVVPEPTAMLGTVLCSAALALRRRRRVARST